MCKNGFERRVSLVTHRWRGVAINMPKMWSRIDLLVDKLQMVECAALYLSRSKAIPFDLKITERLGDDKHHQENGRIVIKVCKTFIKSGIGGIGGISRFGLIMAFQRIIKDLLIILALVSNPYNLGSHRASATY